MVYEIAAVAAESVPGKDGFCKYKQFWLTLVAELTRKTQQTPNLKMNWLN